MSPTLPAVLTACLLVAACGGGASAEHKSKPQPRPLDSPAAIAKLVGCDTPLRNSESMAQVEKVCKVSGVDVLMDRYPDRQAALQFVKLGSSFGASYALVNDHWSVSSNNRALVARIAKRNGWDLQ